MHPRVRTNGSFRDGSSCDFFRFAIFLFCTGAAVDSYVVAFLSVFNLSRAHCGKQGTPPQKEDSLPCSCIAPRKERECPLTRAPSTRLSSLWWEPLRPWSSAVTTPSSDTSALSLIRQRRAILARWKLNDTVAISNTTTRFQGSRRWLVRSRLTRTRRRCDVMFPSTRSCWASHNANSVANVS